MSRGIEDGILDTCRELGIAITAYGVLSRGLISETTSSSSEPTDFRAHAPRFSGENLTHNQRLVGSLRDIAHRHGLTVAQLAIAWVASRGDDIVPLVGMRRRSRIADALAAMSVELDGSDLTAIEQALPAQAVAGERYAPAQMAQLDSER
jgi:aryl-alcohol dehydrogenase-like predicted oxidoreductase